VLAAIVDLGGRRRTNLCPPPVGPVELVDVEVARVLGVSAHVHAVDQTADQRHEAEHQEDYSQNPKKIKKTIQILKSQLFGRVLYVSLFLRTKTVLAESLDKDKNFRVNL